MAAKKMFTDQQKKDIIKDYLDGFSLAEAGAKNGITIAAVHYILKKAHIKRRTIKEGNSLKWENEKFRNNQIDKRIGKPSGALGKKWKMSYRVNKNNKGEKNPMWKGGKTKLSFSIRNSYDYSFWRKQIFERDNYTCQKCGAKNKKGEKYIFDADHIYPFSKILDDFKIKNIEEAIITNGLLKLLVTVLKVVSQSYLKKRKGWDGIPAFPILFPMETKETKRKHRSKILFPVSMPLVKGNGKRKTMSQYRYVLEPYKGMKTRYTCPACQKRDKTFVRYIDTETGQHVASCKELWDIANGRTLCRDCHKKTDTWGTNLKKNTGKGIPEVPVERSAMAGAMKQECHNYQ